MHSIARSVFVSVLVLGFAGSAAAHVVVSPAMAPGASYQTFTISVPNEKTVPTTMVALDIPAGLKSVTPYLKPGWKITTTKNAEGDVTRIEWSGGSIPAEFKDSFQFTLKTPSEPTTLPWKAYQTYQGGEVVAWDQAPVEEDHDKKDAKEGEMAEVEEVANPYSETEITKPVPGDHHGMMGMGGMEGKHGRGMGGSGCAVVLSLIALGIAGYSVWQVRKMKKG